MRQGRVGSRGPALRMVTAVESGLRCGQTTYAQHGVPYVDSPPSVVLSVAVFSVDLRRKFKWCVPKRTSFKLTWDSL
jgi:hypothetical protein